MEIKEILSNKFGGECEEYVEYCLHSSKQGKGSHKHHILPKHQFPEYKNEKWNIAYLTPAGHMKAHMLLFEYNSEFQGGIVALYSRFGYLIDTGLSEDEFNQKIENIYKLNGEKISKSLNKIDVRTGKTIAELRAINSANTMSIKQIDGKTIREKATERQLKTLKEIQHSGKTRAKEIGEAARETMMECQVSGKTKFQENGTKLSKTIKENGLQSGSKNNKALAINIYNENDNLIFTTHGNFKKICEENHLPFSPLKRSYQNGGNKIFNKYRPKKECLLKYKNWYAKVIN